MLRTLNVSSAIVSLLVVFAALNSETHAAGAYEYPAGIPSPKESKTSAHVDRCDIEFDSSVIEQFADISSSGNMRFTSVELTSASGVLAPVDADDPAVKLDQLAHHFNTGRADSHAPIGVMGEHLHNEGEFMFSYRFMYMEMNGNRDGSSRLGDAAVRADGFMVVPTDMQMEMHMFGMMYAPTNDVTLMLMVPYTRLSMHHKAGMTLGDITFKTNTEGIGDIKLTSLIKVFRRDHDQLHLNVGVSLPTGKINEKDTTPMGKSVLPYPMQLGSGTPAVILGSTYVYQESAWSFGGQGIATLQLGRNYRDYAQGHRLALTSWAAYDIKRDLSVSGRLNFEMWGDYRGADTSLSPMMVPTADTSKRGGRRLDALVGVNYLFTDGILKGHRLAVEGGVPVWQNLDGPQLETDWLFTFGWQYAF